MVERREITRTRVRRDVLIFKPDSARAIDGTVRNLTTKGAGLSVPATPVGPVAPVVPVPVDVPLEVPLPDVGPVPMDPRDVPVELAEVPSEGE